MPKSEPHVAVVSHANDLHAQLISKKLEADYGISCLLLSYDTRDSQVEEWLGSLGADSFPSPGRKEYRSRLEELRLVWWRRAPRPEDFVGGDGEHAEFIAVEEYTAFTGSIWSNSDITWISDPVATIRSSNKIVQLRAAEAIDFRIPATVITQDVADVEALMDAVGNQIIVKPLAGTRARLNQTKLITDINDFDAASYAVCPAIYQEFIPGNAHLRVNIFGERIEAFQISTSELDWRFNLNVPVERVEIDTDLAQRLYALVSMLGLKVGIVDLKVSEKGEVVFLEINPQGQFLFLEPLTRHSVSTTFCDFLAGQLN